MLNENLINLQTVLSKNNKKNVDDNSAANFRGDSGVVEGGGVHHPSTTPPPLPPPPPPPPKSPYTWSALAAIALTASLGGVSIIFKIKIIIHIGITETLMHINFFIY